MAMNRSLATAVNDDGTGATGTILNTTWWTAAQDMIDAMKSRVTISLTGTQNNMSITQGGIEGDLILLDNATDITITGIAAPASPAKPGKSIILRPINTGNVYVSYNSGGSLAGNKIITNVSSGLTPILAGKGFMKLTYQDSSARWEITGHEMGGYFQPAFNSANFAGSGSMSWTLASGDRTTSGWKLVGNVLHYFFSIATSSVGGTPSTDLLIGNGEWGGFTSTFGMTDKVAYCLDNNVYRESYMVSGAASTVLAARRADGSNWTASTDQTAISGTFQFQVT